jgi:hypothetical protein
MQHPAGRSRDMQLQQRPSATTCSDGFPWVQPQNPTPDPLDLAKRFLSNQNLRELQHEGPCAGLNVTDLDYSKVRPNYGGSVTESARDHITRNHIDGLTGKSRYETDPPQGRDAMFLQVQFYNAITFAVGTQINEVNPKGKLTGITFIFQFPAIQS